MSCQVSQISNHHYNHINTLRPRQNGRYFADDICKRIFFNENVWISIKISLKFVPKGPINKIPALVQVMAWRRPGDKPLSEPMLISLPTHICVTRPQWVKGPIKISLTWNVTIDITFKTSCLAIYSYWVSIHELLIIWSLQSQCVWHDATYSAFPAQELFKYIYHDSIIKETIAFTTSNVLLMNNHLKYEVSHNAQKFI